MGHKIREGSLRGIYYLYGKTKAKKHRMLVVILTLILEAKEFRFVSPLNKYGL